MTEKFEASKEFAEEWLEYKKIAVPTQEAILLPSIKKIITKSKINICDLGCGDGELTEKMQIFNPTSLLGLDINISLLNIARDRQIPNSQFIYCDLSQDKFPIKDEEFEVLISSNLLMHIDDNSLKHTLQESYRILKEEGEAYFFVTNFEWATSHYELKKIKENTFQSIRRVWHSNVIEYYRTETMYKNEFINNGFEILDVQNLKIPNDNSLSIRYLSKVGLPLFTQYKLRKLK